MLFVERVQRLSTAPCWPLASGLFYLAGHLPNFEKLLGRR